MKDRRHLYVATGCGVCLECMKQKKRAWQIRMLEEIKTNTNGKFVTLTFNDESIEKLTMHILNNEPDHDGIPEANEIATIAVRLFLERWRKKYKTSVKHWLITELGHTGTERIHLHGIIFTDEDIEERWQYGWVYIGKYVNEKTINYITKYVTKTDNDHKGYVPKILCSPGIGRNYVISTRSNTNQYKDTNTNETYRLNNGVKVGLPPYYRNKLYTDDEREKLWSNLLNKEERYVLGNKIDVSTSEGETIYNKALTYAQERNIKLGYHDPKTWKKQHYIASLKMLNKKQM